MFKYLQKFKLFISIVKDLFNFEKRKVEFYRKIVMVIYFLYFIKIENILVWNGKYLNKSIFKRFFKKCIRNIYFF